MASDVTGSQDVEGFGSISESLESVWSLEEGCSMGDYLSSFVIAGLVVGEQSAHSQGSGSHHLLEDLSIDDSICFEDLFDAAESEHSMSVEEMYDPVKTSSDMMILPKPAGGKRSRSSSEEQVSDESGDEEDIGSTVSGRSAGQEAMGPIVSSSVQPLNRY
mmetsp:Transcript_15424/g.25496  ORF Transcript_15424/g.25496 Transcript_15424/m.25496 type:complete len:161 (-) Transcript_15424:150-632(-)